ncbi:MAG: hypothetical protein ABI723_15500 [Bacteroidia bacterium]
MILLQDTLSSFANLPDILKFGLVGLSAIVLILAYNLLSKEQSRTGAARENILKTIKTYMWIALAFLIVSGIWSVIDKLISKPPATDLAKQESPVIKNCNKNFVLNFSLDPDLTELITDSDSLELQYRVRRTETKLKTVPVERAKGQGFTAFIDSLDNDDIYEVKLINRTKKIFWENTDAVSVNYTFTKLIHSPEDKLKNSIQ